MTTPSIISRAESLKILKNDPRKAALEIPDPFPYLPTPPPLNH